MSGWCNILSPLIEVLLPIHSNARKPIVITEDDWYSDGEENHEFMRISRSNDRLWSTSAADLIHEYSVRESISQSVRRCGSAIVSGSAEIDCVSAFDSCVSHRKPANPERAHADEESLFYDAVSQRMLWDVDESIGYDMIGETLKSLIGCIEGSEGKHIKNATRISVADCAQFDVVREVARELGMRVIPTKQNADWDVSWTVSGISVEGCRVMKKYQRANHFPLSNLEMNKMSLARSFAKMAQTFPEEYYFAPETWCLPAGSAKVKQYAATHRKGWFILKPADGSCGRGIVITHDANDLEKYEKTVCQAYIQRPFLIDGFKFDLRVFTLITSCDPLRIFVYNEGLARFATEKYEELSPTNANNRFMHLTNSAVNKLSPSYVLDETKGSIRRLTTIDKWFNEHEIDSKKIWRSMDDIIIKTIIAILPALVHYYHMSFPDEMESNSCFEIFGFDIIFDNDLNPYVLEVNCSPNYSTDDVPLKKEIKKSLVRDTFTILNLLENKRSEQLVEERMRALNRLMNPRQNKTRLRKEKQRRDRLLTQSRIEWENAHMGNYRKIYPNSSSKYYNKFISAGKGAFLQRINL